MRNIFFVMLGLLVGLSLFQYSMLSSQKNSKVAELQTSPANLRQNLIIDPVEILEPELAAHQADPRHDEDEVMLNEAFQRIQSAEGASNSLRLDSEISLLNEIEQESGEASQIESARASDQLEVPVETQ